MPAGEAAAPPRPPPSSLPIQIIFDVLEANGEELLGRPYRHRRAALEERFARGDLTAPLPLCPTTTERVTAQQWLDPTWSAVGIEGAVVKA